MLARDDDELIDLVNATRAKACSTSCPWPASRTEVDAAIVELFPLTRRRRALTRRRRLADATTAAAHGRSRVRTPLASRPVTLHCSPLDAVHRALGAKMVAFGGWEMPLPYPTGTLAEHQACRTDAAAFDVSHLGTVRVDGP